MDLPPNILLPVLWAFAFPVVLGAWVWSWRRRERRGSDQPCQFASPASFHLAGFSRPSLPRTLWSAAHNESRTGRLAATRDRIRATAWFRRLTGLRA